MIYHITTGITDIYTGLALEELIFESTIPEALIVWQSEPSVVMGKFQSIYKEVNLPFINKYHIPIARRSSGGGTVFHDLGNVNITYISNNGSEYFNQKATDLSKQLHKMNIEAVLNDRLSMYCKGLKISGSAQRLRRDRALFHCTLLYNSDLNKLEQALSPTLEQLDEKVDQHKFSVDSVREKVGNIKIITNRPENTTDFIEQLNNRLRHHYDTLPVSPHKIISKSAIKNRAEILKTQSWIYEAKR